ELGCVLAFDPRTKPQQLEQPRDLLLAKPGQSFAIEMADLDRLFAEGPEWIVRRRPDLAIGGVSQVLAWVVAAWVEQQRHLGLDRVLVGHRPRRLVFERELIVLAPGGAAGGGIPMRAILAS